MQTKVLLAIIAVLTLAAAATVAWQRSRDTLPAPTTAAPAPRTQSPSAHAGHNHDNARVPAFQNTVAPGSLPATLAPERFVGQVRLAYQAVREIPETIAQLPCYCYCDEGFGHKSLHTCFVDDHAAGCAVCVEEALLAYRLQTQEGLSPEQIRERIITQYSQPHRH